MKMEKNVKKAGFTIIELLTVMAVIAVLIGLLVPALALVKDSSREIQQQAQFHSIEVGVELYNTAFGAYPPSHENDGLATAPPPSTATQLPYCGANKLAEAMVGWDLMGFHPGSEFTADGFDLAGPPNPVYIPGDAANIEAREDRYVELENANAFKLSDVYDSTLSIGSTTSTALTAYNYFVLCDVFTKKRAGGIKTGTPILYYKANTMYNYQDYVTSPTDIVYTYYDNAELLDLNFAEDNTIDHPLADGSTAPTDYEELDLILQNRQIFESSGIMVPYRAQSYILMSAGKDGRFGNADDIYNFEKGK